MQKLMIGILFVLVAGCTNPTQPRDSSNAIKSLGEAPEFDLERIGGGRIRSADLKGKVVVVDFWATWCQPCIQEIPSYNKMIKESAAKGVEMVAVTFQSGDIGDVGLKVKELGVEYPVAMGTDDVDEGFRGYIGLPTTFVIGKDWKIYKKYLGLTAGKEEAVHRDINTLLENTGD